MVEDVHSLGAPAQLRAIPVKSADVLQWLLLAVDAATWPRQVRRGFTGRGGNFGLRNDRAGTIIIDDGHGRHRALIQDMNDLVRLHALELHPYTWTTIAFNIDSVAPAHAHPEVQGKHAILGKSNLTQKWHVFVRCGPRAS